MAAIPTPSLTEQATTILEAASSLQKQLQQHDLQQPSFEVNGRRDWQDAIDHPEILKARSALIDASNLMMNLALGPVDMLSSLIGPTISKLEVVRTLDDLGVAQAVPLQGDIKVEDLAQKLDVKPKLLKQQLSFAYLMGIFREPREGFVAHTSASAVMSPISLWTQMRLGPLFLNAGMKIPDALRTWRDVEPGRNQVPLSLADHKHRDVWQILQEDDPEGKGMDKFTGVMKVLLALHSGDSATLLARGFDFAGLGDGLVVDVGGGSGHIEVNILNEVPQTINFLIQDLVSNEGPANDMIQSHGAGDRVQFLAHDFFNPQPSELRPKAYILSRIFHDWQDEDCIKILHNLIPAMVEHGTKLFVMDRVIPDPGEVPNHMEQLIRTEDLVLFTLCGGGERNRTEWAALFKKADARLKISGIRSSLLSPFSYIEVVLDGQD